MFNILFWTQRMCARAHLCDSNDIDVFLSSMGASAYYRWPIKRAHRVYGHVCVSAVRKSRYAVSAPIFTLNCRTFFRLKLGHTEIWFQQITRWCEQVKRPAKTRDATKKNRKEKDVEKRSFYEKFIIKIPSASLFKNNRLLCAVCARLYVCLHGRVRTHRHAMSTCPTNILKYIILRHKNVSTVAQTNSKIHI